MHVFSRESESRGFGATNRVRIRPFSPLIEAAVAYLSIEGLSLTTDWAEFGDWRYSVYYAASSFN